jgi:membrane protease YdiL (CAAX protease family)
MPLQVPTDVVLIFLAMCAGPSVASIIMTVVIDGRTGLRDLCSRMGRFQVGIRWYGVALLTVPVLVLALLLTLTALVSPTFAPSLNVMGMVIGLAAGFFEEIGWTGFALPNMQRKYTALTAGLLLGVLWGGWHFLAGYLGGQTLPIFLFFAVSLVAYRVLITRMYTHTESLLLAQLMHAFYTGSLLVLSYSLTASNTLLFNVAFTAVLWVVVAVVVATTGPRLVQAPRRVFTPVSP